MIIVGAGLSGLLAGNMLAKRKPTIFEAQQTLPANHSAVLRFRSSIVGDVLGIPFRRVNMIKTSIPFRNPVADALAYSHKNSGTYRSDRSITSGFVSEERFIAPPDLVARMAEPLAGSIEFGARLTAKDLKEEIAANCSNAVISTMPMPALMDLLDYPGRKNIEFLSSPATNLRARIPDCDAYVSLMVPHPSISFSRVSITGDELIIECVGEPPTMYQYDGILQVALQYLGIDDWLWPVVRETLEVKQSKYAKIAPIPEHHRRAFMHWATDNHNIFSLGRFACWRPKTLMDDLVQDIRKIERWSSDRYALRGDRSDG